MNTFLLTSGWRVGLMVGMTSCGTKNRQRWCWRKDLAGFRGLTDRERVGFLLVLEWFENFRLRHEMEAGEG